MRIGFVGLGRMGLPMVANLCRRPFDVLAFDVHAQALQAAAAAGANTASSLDELADCAVIFTMLPGPQQVREVYLGEKGLLAALRFSSALPVLVDCSTIDPHTAHTVRDAAQAQGIVFADAPVSGGTVGATHASLTFMVGCDEASTLPRVQPALQAMGKNIFHCGRVGMGQTAKLSNNLVIAIAMLGAAEAMQMGVSLGMEPDKLAEILNVSTAHCWCTDGVNPYPGAVAGAPAGRGYSGGFATHLMLKDVGLAVQMAERLGQPMPMGALAQQQYRALSVLRGMGELDFSAVIRLYQPTP